MKNRYELSADGESCRVYFIDGSSFLIDTSDLLQVSEYTWFYGKRGYPVAHTSRKSPEGHKVFPLHRLLMRPDEGSDVDHISGDKLDNRRGNLRICSHQQNMFNQKMRCTNSSGYYGVSRSSKTGKFEAYLHIDGRKKYLGTYDSAEQAAVARDAAAVRFFGDYARLNKNEEAAS